MKTNIWWSCGLVAIVVTAGCGTIGASEGSSPQATAGVSAGGESSPASTETLIKSYRKSTIAPNWDHLVDQPLDVSVKSAQSEGGLRFRPLVPSIAEAPTRGQVGPSSARSEDRFFIMQLGQKPDASDTADSRVFITQSSTTMTQETLRSIAAGNAESGQYMMRQTPLGEVLLIAANGSSRVLAVSGGILVDVTGPAVPEARTLAIMNSVLAIARVPSVTVARKPSAASAAQQSCDRHKPSSAAKVTHAFVTTAGVVKARRVGPTPSPAATAWRVTPASQVAYWCEAKSGRLFSVYALTSNQKPVRFVTSNVPVLAGPEGPLVP